jgi:hypothetical protein
MRTTQVEQDRVTNVPEHRGTDGDRFLDSPRAALLASAVILLVIFVAALAGSATM